MFKTLARVLAPAALVAAAIVPLVGGTAVADPACAQDVYGKKIHSGSQSGYQIDVTLNRCDRPTRAMARCSGLGGAGVNYGPSITRGTSRTEYCARGFDLVNYGWQVYYDGKWNNRW
ncbi:MAG TPA: hypothetical protein VIU15_42500, partial [Streptomyces sp.]